MTRQGARPTQEQQAPVVDEKAEAGERRAAAAADPMTVALLEERRGYVNRGLTERVAQVDAALAVRGHTGDD